MLTAKRDIEEFDRGIYAISLLESSSYDEPHKLSIIQNINISSADEIELIIQDLLLNQVDSWSNYRLKDINRRLNAKGC